MKRKPVIGLTPLYHLENKHMWMQDDYLDAVDAAGGIPLVLPIRLGLEDLPQVLERVDGLLFTGGPDVMPHLFGERTIKECGAQSPLRDELELPLIRVAVAAKTPVMGICRGIQTINIALGGNIYQDIGAQYQPDISVIHSQSDYVSRDYPSHKVRVAAGSLLYEAVGEEELLVNSYHHQAVKELAPALKATAWSEDGLVECLEGAGDGFVLGVQWHPEGMHRRDDKALALFRLLVKKSMN